MTKRKRNAPQEPLALGPFGTPESGAPHLDAAAKQGADKPRPPALEDPAVGGEADVMPRVVRCPVCYETRRGRGRPLGMHGQRWALECRQCGHSWTKFVKVQNQCPICWRTLGGVGRLTSSTGNTKYFACDCCGQTWSAVVKTIVDRVVYQLVERIECDQAERYEQLPGDDDE